MREETMRSNGLLRGGCGLIACLFALAAVPPLAAQEAQAPDDAAAADTIVVDDEIMALVAPVALYPDPLLAVILQASMFPVDVVQADRFIERYQADQTLEPSDQWDPSLIALLNYPPVLAEMNEHLDWTQAMGDAVYDQLDDVQDGIQDLRQGALAMGVLASNDVQEVVVEEGIVQIRPTTDGPIAIPQYDGAALLAALQPVAQAPADAADAAAADAVDDLAEREAAVAQREAEVAQREAEVADREQAAGESGGGRGRACRRRGVCRAGDRVRRARRRRPLRLELRAGTAELRPAAGLCGTAAAGHLCRPLELGVGHVRNVPRRCGRGRPARLRHLRRRRQQQWRQQTPQRHQHRGQHDHHRRQRRPGQPQEGREKADQCRASRSPGPQRAGRALATGGIASGRSRHCPTIAVPAAIASAGRRSACRSATGQQDTKVERRESRAAPGAAAAAALQQGCPRRRKAAEPGQEGSGARQGQPRQGGSQARRGTRAAGCPAGRRRHEGARRQAGRQAEGQGHIGSRQEKPRQQTRVRRPPMNKLVTLTVAAGLAGVLASGGAALAQQPSFADPEAALEAFREALFAPEDSGRLLDLLGEEHGEALIGADPATARQTMAAARNAAGEALRIAPWRGSGHL
jgi:hypothetical protein